MVKNTEDKKAKVGAVKNTEDKTETPEGATNEAPKEEVLPKKGKKTSVVVSWRGNTREFSLDIHGEDFETLAQQFADKFDGTIE